MDIILIRLIRFTALIITVCFFVATARAQDPVRDDNLFNPELRLLLASSRGDTALIRILIGIGTDVNTIADDGSTPLMIAVMYQKPSAALMLLNAGADPDKGNYLNETPLIAAIRLPDLEMAEMLIKAGANINGRDINGATALHYAALLGYYYEADMLLYYDARPDLRSHDGTTPLMASVMSGSFDIADILIREGSNVNATDKNKYTPLLLAAQNGDSLTIELLLMNGADLYAVADDGYNAAAIAIRDAYPELFGYLLRKGAFWGNKSAVSLWRVAEQYRRKEFVPLLHEFNIVRDNSEFFTNISAELSLLTTSHQSFAGITLRARRELNGTGILLGADLKPFRSRILIQEDKNNFVQYIDQRFILYAGLFKDFIISENLSNSTWLVNISGKAAYKSGNSYPGSKLRPESTFAFIPSISLCLEIPYMTFSLSTEYIRTEVYKSGPFWFRAGISFNYYSSNVKSKGKTIRWY